MTTCYLCNSEIMEWEEGLVVKVGDKEMSADEACQNEAWLNAQGDLNDN